MTMMRTERVAQQLQQEIATIIHRELKDPRLGFVTITRVVLSKDFRHAKVLFSCLGPREDRDRSQDALDHSTKFVRELVKKRFRLKVIPEIVFQYDESIEGTIALEQMFERLKRPPEVR